MSPPSTRRARGRKTAYRKDCGQARPTQFAANSRNAAAVRPCCSSPERQPFQSARAAWNRRYIARRLQMARSAAIEAGAKPIVVINKIDRENARRTRCSI
jgi:hypothetical protein